MPEHVGNMWEPRQDLRGSPGTPPGSLLLAQASGRTVRRAPSSRPPLHPSPRTRARPGPAACSLPGACHPSAAGLEREPWPAHRQPAPRGTVRSLRGACAEVPRQAPWSEALLPHCAPGRLPPGSEPWFRGPPRPPSSLGILCPSPVCAGRPAPVRWGLVPPCQLCDLGKWASCSVCRLLCTSRQLHCPQGTGHHQHHGCQPPPADKCWHLQWGDA